VGRVALDPLAEVDRLRDPIIGCLHQRSFAGMGVRIGTRSASLLTWGPEEVVEVGPRLASDFALHERSPAEHQSCGS